MVLGYSDSVNIGAFIVTIVRHNDKNFIVRGWYMNKLLSLSLCSVFITGCSSSPKISMEPYENNIYERCISTLPQEMQADPEEKRDCKLDAIFAVDLASEIYSQIASEQRLECRDSFSDEAEADACYLDKQRMFFDNWMKSAPVFRMSKK